MEEAYVLSMWDQNIVSEFICSQEMVEIQVQCISEFTIIIILTYGLTLMSHLPRSSPLIMTRGLANAITFYAKNGHCG